MIFTTKNKELAIFGQTLSDVKKKLVDFNDIWMQGGRFGSNKSQLIPEANLTKILSFDEANKQLEDFNRRVVQGGMSLDTYFKQYQNGNAVLRNYVTTTDQQSQSTQGLIRASEEARATQLAHNESIKAGTISAKAASVAFKALSIAGNIIAFTVIAKGIRLATTAIDNWIHRVEKANEAMDKAVGEYDSAKSSLESINSELAEQNKKIDELLAKDKLTYAEQGQLEELQAITRELLLQQDIEQRRADKASKDVAEKTVDAYEKQYGKYDISREHLNETLDYINSTGISVIADSENDIIGNIAAYVHATEMLTDLKNGENTEYLASDVQDYIDAIDDYSDVLDQNISDLQEKSLALEDEYNKAITKRENGQDLTSYETDAINTYESIYDAMKLIYEYTNQNAWNNMEISNIFNTEGIEKTKEELISLAEAGKLTPEYITQNFKTLNKAVQDSEIFLKDDQTTVEAFCEEIYRSSEMALQFRDALSSAKSKFGDTIELETEALNEARENLENEYEKLSNWGLEDYAEKIKNDTISSIFGNVDMDKRTIITWSDELKQTYADALASWDYDPEIGGIDTVFGGSSRFGENINGTGWEVAFTPILPDGTFLSSDTVYEYIESIVAEAYDQNGEVTQDALKSIDAQGKQIGDTFVHGIFAAVDDSLDYDNNGNLAETVGRLMHFTGDFGAVKLAKQEIEDARKVLDWDSWFSENVKTSEEIEIFQEIIQEANNAADAIEKYKTAISGLSNENTISSLSDLLNTEDLSDTKKELLELAKSGELTPDTFTSTKEYMSLLEQTGLTAKQACDEIKKLPEFDMDMSNWQTQLQNARSNISELKDMLEELTSKDSTGLSTSSVDKIVSDYPMLLQYLSDTPKLIEEINSLLTDQSDIANNAADQIIEYSTDAYIDIRNTAQETFDSITVMQNGQVQSVADMYGIDLNNYSNLAQAKKSIEFALLGSLNEGWAEHFGIVIDSLSGMAKVTQDLGGFYADPEAQSKLAAYNELITKLNSAKSNFEANIDYGSAGVDKSKSKSKTEKDTTKPFDWIEQAIKNVEKEVTNLDNVVNSAYSTFSQKNEALAKEISKVNEEIQLQQQAYDEYMRKADSIGLSDDYKTLIHDGAINIENISDEKLQEKISDYQQWYEKAVDASDAISELSTKVKDLHVAGYELQADRLEELLDNESITEKQYLSEMKNLYKEYYENQVEYAQKAHEAKLALLDREKQYLNSVANAATSLLDKEIGKVQDNAKEQQKPYEDQIKAAEKQIDAYQDQIDIFEKQIDTHNKQIDAYNKEIDLINDRKKPLQDELDALEDEAREENLILDLQEKQYARRRAENQNDKLVYYMPDTIVI